MYRCGIFRVALTAMVLVFVVSCTKNEFTVDIDLPADVDRTYSLVYYASDRNKGWIVETVVAVQKGKAQVKCATVRPTLVYLMSNSDSAPQALFYAKRGSKIKITGKGPDPASWTIEGNKITDALTAFRLSAAADYELLRKDPERGTAALNKALETYAGKNPESPVSAILLLTQYDRRADEPGFARAWKKLEGDAAKAEWLELVARADMTGTYDPIQKIPSRILLGRAGTLCDTIDTGRVPVLLYFSKPDGNSYKEDMRSLGELSREYSDSSRRLIADISFETDSMTRFSAIRRDTLKNSIRAWMPLGVSDQTARQLGVTRVPYVIVIGAKGETLYRGDRMNDALSLFKKSLK